MLDIVSAQRSALGSLSRSARSKFIIESPLSPFTCQTSSRFKPWHWPDISVVLRLGARPEAALITRLVSRWLHGDRSTRAPRRRRTRLLARRYLNGALWRKTSARLSRTPIASCLYNINDSLAIILWRVLPAWRVLGIERDSACCLA